MPLINDHAKNVEIVNQENDKSVDIIIDGNSIERLAVDAGAISSVEGLFFPGFYQNKQLVDGASSPDMNVDGSSTPVSFTAVPSTSKIFYVSRLIIYMEDASMNHSKFAGISGGITNGIDIKATEDGVERTLQGSITRNGGFYNIAHDIDIASASTDVFTMRWSFHRSGTWIRLKDSTSDNIKIVVNDDLTSVDVFKAVVQGFEVDE